MTKRPAVGIFIPFSFFFLDWKMEVNSSGEETVVKVSSDRMFLSICDKRSNIL